ncbi:TBC1 domain family member 13 protein [Pelomyxa schiedti]|nr:TBC1 domain family member 13 protein [Pelomyxa schiedti]
MIVSEPLLVSYTEDDYEDYSTPLSCASPTPAPTPTATPYQQDTRAPAPARRTPTTTTTTITSDVVVAINNSEAEAASPSPSSHSRSPSPYPPATLAPSSSVATATAAAMPPAPTTQQQGEEPATSSDSDGGGGGADPPPPTPPHHATATAASGALPESFPLPSADPACCACTCACKCTAAAAAAGGDAGARGRYRHQRGAGVLLHTKRKSAQEPRRIICPEGDAASNGNGNDNDNAKDGGASLLTSSSGSFTSTSSTESASASTSSSSSSATKRTQSLPIMNSAKRDDGSDVSGGTEAPQGCTSPEPQPNISAALYISMRISQFKDALLGPRVNLHLIKQLAFTGIPEISPLRSVYWKLMLNYLPLEVSQWNCTLDHHRSQYWDWYKELTHVESQETETISSPQVRVGVETEIHPLGALASEDLRWKNARRDFEVCDQIDKDVKRTFSTFHFFTDELRHSLRRILFVYAKFNPGLLYVQGMNEIAGHLFYVFQSDEDKKNAEADAFFCFTNLMTEIMDNFVTNLDDSERGVNHTVDDLSALLKARDPEIWQDLYNKGIDMRFFAFRWITLLLSQEFDLPDVLRLWDSFFSDESRFEFLLYFCCAMLIFVREQLLKGSFPENMELLQNYPPTDFQEILDFAVLLRNPPTASPTIPSSHCDSPSTAKKHTLWGKFKPKTPKTPARSKNPITNTGTPPQQHHDSQVEESDKSGSTPTNKHKTPSKLWKLVHHTHNTTNQQLQPEPSANTSEQVQKQPQPQQPTQRTKAATNSSESLLDKYNLVDCNVQLDTDDSKDKEDNGTTRKAPKAPEANIDLFM